MTEKTLLKLIILHISIGFLIVFNLFFSKIYAILIVLIGFWYVVKYKNKNHEVLYVIAYITGCEVFLRTTYGNPVHEFGKYLMLFFTLLGLFYCEKPKIKNPYKVYLILILPATIISFFTLTCDYRRKIFFEILGPICIGTLALYTYRREVSSKTIHTILNIIALPIITTCVFLLLNYTINSGVLDTYRSSYFYSGGYAPNQMATLLGLGIVVCFFKILFDKYTKKIFYFNLILFCVIYYRGLLTFSRGGITTGLVVIFCVILTLYVNKNLNTFLKKKIAVTFFLLFVVFILTFIQTDGKVFNRYIGTFKKETIGKGGRFKQLKYDLTFFKENPVFGIGVGKAKELRKIKYATNVSSHTEISRLLSEHGILGVALLVILLFFPLKLYFDDLNNIYIFPFFMFWLLSINHSATRTIAPSFIYAIALMKLKNEDEFKSNNN